MPPQAQQPSRQQPQQFTVTHQQIQAIATSGPLPQPEVLERYEKILPGLSQRIIEMAETQGKHRREIESKTLDANIKIVHKAFTEARIGQIAALIIGIVAILAGTYTATHGAPTAGAWMGGGGVVGLVSVFIFGRWQQRQQPQPPAQQ